MITIHYIVTESWTVLHFCFLFLTIIFLLLYLSVSLPPKGGVHFHKANTHFIVSFQIGRASLVLGNVNGVNIIGELEVGMHCGGVDRVVNEVKDW